MQPLLTARGVRCLALRPA